MKKKFRIILLFVLVATIVVVGCQSTDAVGSSEDAIDAIMADWTNGMIREEIDLMMSAYAADAIVVTPEGDEIVGYDTIRDMQLGGMEGMDNSIFVVDRASETPDPSYQRTYTVTVPGEVTLYNSFSYKAGADGVRIVRQKLDVGDPIE